MFWMSRIYCRYPALIYRLSHKFSASRLPAFRPSKSETHFGLDKHDKQRYFCTFLSRRWRARHTWKIDHVSEGDKIEFWLGSTMGTVFASKVVEETDCVSKGKRSFEHTEQHDLTADHGNRSSLIDKGQVFVELLFWAST
jgi:hypothetical protein